MKGNTKKIRVLPTLHTSLFTFHSFFAAVAQLVEQLIRNQQVVGSTPIFGSRKTRGYGNAPQPRFS